jgi:hypothetical protein
MNTPQRYPMAATDASFYESAPVRFDNSVEIPAPAPLLWKILEDDHSWTIWAGVIDRVEWTSPKPFGLGTTRTVTMAKGAMTGWEQFIAWEAGKRMGFCFTHASMKGIARFAEDWQVTPIDAHHCRVRWVMCMEPQGINRYILNLFAPIMRFNFRRYLKSLSRYAQKQSHNPKFSC